MTRRNIRELVELGHEVDGLYLVDNIERLVVQVSRLERRLHHFVGFVRVTAKPLHVQ